MQLTVIDAILCLTCVVGFAIGSILGYLVIRDISR